MKVPVSWLKDFVDINITTEELAKRLVSCGFEIEEIIKQSDSIKNVVTGKIISIEKHPNADKLFICQIDVGTETVQIVTAATNVKAGDIVPVALDGALLASGKTIKKGALRDVESFGMLCSGGELNLTEEDFVGAGIYGILILPKNTEIGKDINGIIGSGDIILDISVTANRQDCNSILGIAREVAAVTNQKVKKPDMSFKETKEDILSSLTVENRNYKLCPRYMARVVRNVKIEASPKVVRDRLKAVGIRPINNLVDITNYVLYEIGQPMHAFDKAMLAGNKIIVRTAEDNEKILALDDKEYSLSTTDLVICDAEKPVAVAGIMGGKTFSISEVTKDIVFESAKFARDSIRHTSRKLNLRSDSSQRFEKGLDLQTQETGMNRALALMYKYGWGEIVSGTLDAREAAIENKVIKLDYNEINKILGINIEKETIAAILNSLELNTTVSGNNLTVILPIFRDDIVGICDLAEEVIRIYGYDHIIPTLIENATMVKGGKTAKQKRMDKIKAILVAHSAFEIVSYSFVSPKALDMLHLEDNNPLRNVIRVANPIGIDFSVMRTSLAYSMIKTLAGNFTRGNKEGRFFEVAKTYVPKTLPLAELPTEEYKLSIGIYGENEDFYTIKAIIEDILKVMGIAVTYKRAEICYLHSGRSASILDNGKEIGYFGEVHPDVLSEFEADKRLYIAEIDVKYIIDNGKDIKPFIAISKYQSMERDLAIIMDRAISVQQALDIIKEQGGEILEDSYVFDVYEGDQVPSGKKSVAIKLIFRELNRTLTDDEVSTSINNILTKLSGINARLR